YRGHIKTEGSTYTYFSKGEFNGKRDEGFDASLRFGCVSLKVDDRDEAARTHRVSGLADQRLRLLPGYAFKGPASRGRDRAADLSRFGLARDRSLLAARKGGACMGRSRHETGRGRGSGRG